jgi:hypothetical protein
LRQASSSPTVAVQLAGGALHWSVVVVVPASGEHALADALHVA